MENLSIEKLVNLLPKAFIPEKAGNANATIQLIAKGENGGSWLIEIKNNQCKVFEGKTETPDLMLVGEAQDFLDIFTGKLDGMQAFMRGKIQFKGNMGLAMKLTGYFSTESEIFTDLK